MTIERWTDRDVFVLWVNLRSRAYCVASQRPAAGPWERIEVVPSDLYRGAVSALREIHELVQTPSVDPEALLNTIFGATTAALRDLGGQ